MAKTFFPESSNITFDQITDWQSCYSLHQSLLLLEKDPLFAVPRSELSSGFRHCHPPPLSPLVCLHQSPLRLAWWRSGTTPTFSNTEVSSAPSSYSAFVSSGATILPGFPCYYPKPLVSHLILWLCLCRFLYQCCSRPGASVSHAILTLFTSYTLPLTPHIFLCWPFHHLSLTRERYHCRQCKGEGKFSVTIINFYIF